MTSGDFPTRAESVSLSRILPVGLLAIVVACVANVVIQLIARAVMEISPEFLPLASPVPIILFTAIGVALAVGVFAIIARRSARPISTFRTVASVALIISLIPNVLILLNPAAVPGSSPGAVIVLMVMHVVAYLVVVWLLTTRTGAGLEGKH